MALTRYFSFYNERRVHQNLSNAGRDVFRDRQDGEGGVAMKQAYTKRILSSSNGSRVMRRGDERILMRFTDGFDRGFHTSQFSTLNDSPFPV
jgi:hypothetical protein